MAVIYRELELRFPNNDRQTITGSNIMAESMTITKSICDGNLKLGGCIATQFDLQLIGIRPDEIQGKKIQAVFLEYSDEHFEVLYPSEDLIPSDNLIPDGHLSYNCTERIIFTGYVDSAKRQKQREIVNLTAYDDLYRCGNKNVSVWFSQFAQHSGDAYIMAVIDSLFTSQIGYDENFRPDGMQWVAPRWGKSVDNNNYTKPLSLSEYLVESIYKGDILAVDVLRSANELMGRFGYITPDGKYTTMSIAENTPIEIDRWITLDFEEYVTTQIDITTFNYNDSKKCTFGRTSQTKSCYYSEDNILTNCSTDYTIVRVLADNVMNNGKLGRKEFYQYRPFKMKTAEELIENQNIGLGSRLKIHTNYADLPYVESFVFQEKITGIQHLQYEFSAEGDQVLNGYDNIDERI